MKDICSLILILLFLMCQKLQAQWQEVFYDSTYDWLSDVKFLNNDTGYVCGLAYPPGGVILMTTDGGTTWDSTQLCCFWPMSLSIVNSNIIYTCGQDGIQFKTLNGGQTWIFNGTLPANGEDATTIYFLNHDTGFAVRSYVGIWRTVDSTTWTLQQSGGHSSFPNTSSVQFINDSVGFAANESVYKTNNCGITWQQLNVDSNLKATCIFMKNINDGIVVGKNGKVSRTFDGGSSWTIADTIAPSANTLFDVAFINDSVGYIVGGNDYYDLNSFGNIFITYDGGYTWTIMQSFNHSLTSLYFVNDSVGYAVGQQGEILKISNANTIGISEIKQKNSVLVFPNPFHSTTTFKLNVEIQNVELKIYDRLGRKVLQQNIIDQNTTINCNDLIDGIYFYRVTNDSGVISIGKLIIE
jgi:photosystem II stability/assembly factor-like uncharacterized protein